MNFGSGNLTIEGWINTTSAAQYATIYSNTIATFASTYWTLLINNASATAGDVAVYVGDYSTTTPLLLTTGVSVRDGTWHHIAVVRNGSAWVLYVDGTSRATGTWAGTIVAASNLAHIGHDPYYGRFFAGYIDDFRVTPGYARYTSNFTPPAGALPNV